MKTDRYNHIDGLHGQRITRFDLWTMRDPYTCIHKPTPLVEKDIGGVSTSYVTGLARAENWSHRVAEAHANPESRAVFRAEQISLWCLEQAAADGQWDRFVKKVWEPHCLALQYKRRRVV